VIEGDDVSERFALVCNEMPESIRLRISEIVDEEKDIDNNVFKYVKMGKNSFMSSLTKYSNPTRVINKKGTQKFLFFKSTLC
jgi:hypothetical protein